MENLSYEGLKGAYFVPYSKLSFDEKVQYHIDKGDIADWIKKNFVEVKP